ncbi:hypothetical protein [Vibrio vulnificus]
MNNNLKDIFDKSRQELLDMGLRGNTLLSLGKGMKNRLLIHSVMI